MDVARRPPGELTVVGFALLALGGLSVTEGARNGQDNLTVLGAFAFAALVIGILGPIVTARGVTVHVDSPADIRVGDTAELTLRLERDGNRRPTSIAVRVLDPEGEWHQASLPGSGTLRHVATRRGVYHYLAIEVRVTAPIGVLARRKVVVVELDHPVYVAPRPTAVVLESLIPTGGDDAEGTPDRGGDRVRSVRPYTSGDPMRAVHWRTSARLGTLMVRELDRGSDGPVLLRVDLRPGDDADLISGVAGGAGRAVLLQRRELLVAATLGGEAAVVPVASVRELDRVLAAAEVGAVDVAGPDDGPYVIDARALAGRESSLGEGERH